MANIKLDNNILHLSGSWTFKQLGKLGDNLLEELLLPTYPIILDGSQIEQLDSAGALALAKLKMALNQANIKTTEQGFNHQHQALMHLVEKTQQQQKEKIHSPLTLDSIWVRIGKATVKQWQQVVLWMVFVGEFAIMAIKLLSKPKQIPWGSIVASIDFTGIRSLPIMAFLSFLIGVVLAYQFGQELKAYGANIYIVNFLGIAILREFGPLIAAIILAGRVSSAFTAHIGLMKTNEELDALKTMGLSPIQLLIIPRMTGMIIAMPLLIVWCDIFGILGGMLMAKFSLGINYHNFLIQFPQAIDLPIFLIGLSKAPAFAMVVAAVGCFYGLRVPGSADGIGHHTTKSVVLAIFLIIVTDALFSVLLSYLGV